MFETLLLFVIILLACLFTLRHFLRLRKGYSCAICNCSAYCSDFHQKRKP